MRKAFFVCTLISLTAIAPFTARAQSQPYLRCRALDQLQSEVDLSRDSMLRAQLLTVILNGEAQVTDAVLSYMPTSSGAIYSGNSLILEYKVSGISTLTDNRFTPAQKLPVLCGLATTQGAHSCGPGRYPVPGGCGTLKNIPFGT